jgi:nitrate reductase cytochrome c-type subunit
MGTATFPIHDNFYQLAGAHAAISNDCVACHNGDYNNTPNTVLVVITHNYNQTINPNHITQQFPMNCTDCQIRRPWDFGDA